MAETAAANLVKAEAVEAAETEEGAEAWVGDAPPWDLEDLEMPQGCGYAMKCISQPFPCGLEKTCAPFLQVGSSPHPRVTFFARTSTCAKYAGKTASVKICTSPPSLIWR